MFLVPNPYETRVIEIEAPIAIAAYASGDSIGVPIRIPNMLKELGRAVDIISISVLDEEGAAPQFSLLFFDAKITGVADNAAFTATVAEKKHLKFLQKIVTADYVTVDGDSFALKAGYPLAELTSETKIDFYLQLIADAAIDLAAETVLHLKVQVAYK